MRCTPVEFHARFPISENYDSGNCDHGPRFRDLNGVVYTIDAIKNSCKENTNVPVIQFQADGTPKTIGIVKSIKWDPEGFVEVNGVLRFGGTCEDVILDKTEIVIGMTITEIGLET